MFSIGGLSSSFLLTSNRLRIGFKMLPTPKIVRKEYIRVSMRIIGPISRSVAHLRAKAYAMAPLSPESHIMNLILPGILVFSVLEQFTKDVVIITLRNLAKFRLRMVVITSPVPIFSYGWLNAKRPIPKKRKTSCSAVTATVS